MPENPYVVAPPVVPETRAECCRLGVAAEEDNIAMYDALLPVVKKRDIKNVFTNLRAASLNNHLPAFTLCS